MTRRGSPSRTMMLLMAGLAVGAAPVSVMHAQGEGNTPPGWLWVTNGPVRVVNDGASATGSDDAMWFVAMPPGFHITMGPGGQLFDQRVVATGRFAIESESFLFPGSATSGYGVLFGGWKFGTDDARWVAALIRGDGRVALVRHDKGVDTPLADWTLSSAVVAARPGGTSRNVLRVEVTGEELVVHVNGAEALRTPRAGVDLDGIVGLHVGAGVNLHVTTLDLTRHLAPVPAPKPPGE